MATRNLTFTTYGLKSDITLMLCFEAPDSSRLFVDTFPVVWKVIYFRAGAHCRASVSYSGRLAFGQAQVNHENKVEAEVWEEVQSGETTVLLPGSAGNVFTPAISTGKGHLISMKNQTRDRVNVTIGFVDGDDLLQRYEPMLYWGNVGSNAAISTQFTPKLRAYVTQDYKATEILRGECETDSIWLQDVDELGPVSSFKIVETRGGSYEIERSLVP
ncbi:hypothetical protein FRC03_010405 [Tulasnella sp. 419]|nr:hypothetical protein FRC02_007336 [Tulasnella sp. 418]KAG8970215.1 hypothetical protein FRC03_010405 [Tulasnella sp. 419]